MSATQVPTQQPKLRFLQSTLQNFRLVINHVVWLAKGSPVSIILVMGPTGTGKSTFINSVSGSKMRIGTGLQSETAAVERTEPFQVGSQRVVLVDTPGFDDTMKSDRDVLTVINDYLARLHWEHIKIQGIIYLHRITDNRMGGTALRNFKMFQAMCGHDAMRNAIIVLNMWDQVGKEVREARMAELRDSDIFFKPAVEAGARVLPHDSTPSSAVAILTCLLERKPVSLQIQVETVDDHMAIAQTAAGMALLGHLGTMENKHVQELIRLRKELESSEDEKERKELQEIRMSLEQAGRKMADEQVRLQGMKGPVRRQTDEPAPPRWRLRGIARMDRRGTVP
ncbi:P-loop containing nucleoside triphosphate hydrolase protein [Rhodofomes roseus]|uniref:P-loop containing nucleoside triphosphate hydrolase protein n=1 Tax=Rhodofomes roseus TaxID=34475 RepID=A0ABQ8JY61_9APHY|nr:P-loop containing nucleoside triphosphate hydrolase protein [Rhodofomes roseus]KAH9829192.1 P-loop containing nucleoside triphosphate hydrolase protein [Rhodofomes roseus]